MRINYNSYLSYVVPRHRHFYPSSTSPAPSHPSSTFLHQSFHDLIILPILHLLHSIFCHFTSFILTWWKEDFHYSNSESSLIFELSGRMDFKCKVYMVTNILRFKWIVYHLFSSLLIIESRGKSHCKVNNPEMIFYFIFLGGKQLYDLCLKTPITKTCFNKHFSHNLVLRTL